MQQGRRGVVPNPDIAGVVIENIGAANAPLAQGLFRSEEREQSKHTDRNFRCFHNHHFCLNYWIRDVCNSFIIILIYITNNPELNSPVINFLM
jgi:hypothetical protein